MAKGFQGVMIFTVDYFEVLHLWHIEHRIGSKKRLEYSDVTDNAVLSKPHTSTSFPSGVRPVHCPTTWRPLHVVDDPLK